MFLRILTLCMFSAFLGCSDSTGPAPRPTDSPESESTESLSPAEGREALSSGDFMKARHGMTEFLKAHPKDLDAMLVLALAKAGERDWKGADGVVNDLKALGVDDPRIYAVESVILHGQNQFKLAATKAEQALGRHPDNKHLHHVLLLCYEAQGDEFKSRQHYSRLAEIDPTYDGIPVSGEWEATAKWIHDHQGGLIAFLGLLAAVVKFIAELA